MGFLRKIVKKVKKGVKKVVKGVKKVFKKITSSKALKAIALVGAAIVTGGAFVGAYGGTLANSTVGSWLASTSSNILATPVIGTLATPFKWLGATAGTGAGKVTDFLGFTSEAGRLNLDKIAFDPVNKGYLNIETGQPLTPTEVANLPSSFKDTAQVSGSYLDSSGKIVRAGDKVEMPEQTGNFLSNIGTGLQFAKDAAEVYQDLQDPEVYGRGGSAGRETEFGLDMQPLQLAYAQPVVNIGDAYSNLSYGTGDIGYLASDLYRQKTI
tara:strand:- start:13 stop:816 length:804 start_codon:yes stop_codon:yes gene_type:complete